MKRNKFKIYMISFIIVSVAILTGFAFNNIENKTQQTKYISQSETSESVNGNYNAKIDDGLSNVSFYINDGTVEKTKTTINETTMFTLKAKMFITNNGIKTESIDVDEFKASYDTEGAGLLYSIEYENIENPILLQAEERVSVVFTIKYIITDVENFNDYKKHELKFSYADNQILSCQV